LKIVLGLWSFEGGVAKAEERIGSGCADIVATSLEQAIDRLAEASQSSPGQSSTSQSATSSEQTRAS